MLWLAGLVGMAGVGAAAFVGVKPDTTEEDDTLPDELMTSGEGETLLTQIKGHSAAGGLLHSDTTVAFNAPATAASGDTWGDDVLNEIMAEFEATGGETADTPAPSHETTYSSAMLNAEDVDLGEESAVDQLLSDWIAERDGAEILDYEARTESLMIVWDDSDAAAAEPQVGVSPDPDDPEVMHVSMNGENVAEVYGDAELSVADLTLIPLSSAMAVGLEAV